MKVTNSSRVVVGLALVVVWGCSGVRSFEEASQDVWEVGSVDAYLTAPTAKALGNLVSEDLGAGEVRKAVRGVEALVRDGMVRGHAAHVLALFEGARLENRFLYSESPGARRYVNEVKSHLGVLRAARSEQLQGLYQGLRDGELDRVKTALGDPKSCLSPGVVAGTPGMKAHAEFFRGIIALDDLVGQDAASAEQALAHLETARLAFLRTDRKDEYFLSQFAIAQAQERWGTDEEAAEAWMSARVAGQQCAVSPATSDWMEQRIESHRSRLERQLRASMSEQMAREKEALVARYNTMLSEAQGELASMEQSFRQQTQDLKDLRELQRVNWSGPEDLHHGVAMRVASMVHAPKGTAGESRDAQLAVDAQSAGNPYPDLKAKLAQTEALAQKLEAERQGLAESLRELELELREFKTAYQVAQDRDVWPVPVRGVEYSQEQLIVKVEKLLLQRNMAEERMNAKQELAAGARAVAAKFEKALKRLEWKEDEQLLELLEGEFKQWEDLLHRERGASEEDSLQVPE